MNKSRRAPAELLAFITAVTISEEENGELEGLSEVERVSYMNNIEEIRNAKAVSNKEEMANSKNRDFTEWAASLKESELGKMLGF